MPPDAQLLLSLQSIAFEFFRPPDDLVFFGLTHWHFHESVFTPLAPLQHGYPSPIHRFFYEGRDHDHALLVHRGVVSRLCFIKFKKKKDENTWFVVAVRIPIGSVKVHDRQQARMMPHHGSCSWLLYMMHNAIEPPILMMERRKNHQLGMSWYLCINLVWISTLFEWIDCFVCCQISLH